MVRGLPLWLAALVACQSESGAADASVCLTPLPIVAPDVWSLVDDRDDPFRRKVELDAGTATTATTSRGRCGPLDAAPETFGDTASFGIKTLFCSFATVETPAKTDVAEGTPLDLRIWHFSLIRIEAAEARVLLAVGDRIFWERMVPLPVDGSLLFATVQAPFKISRGDMIRWHVSNHGQNAWNFIELSTPVWGLCPADR